MKRDRGILVAFILLLWALAIATLVFGEKRPEPRERVKPKGRILQWLN